MKRLASRFAISMILFAANTAFAAGPAYFTPQRPRAFSPHYARVARTPVRPLRAYQYARPVGINYFVNQEAPPPAPAANGHSVQSPANGYTAPSATAYPHVGLYPYVEYEDLKNIHPCAVPQIISVPHPCPDPCSCSSPGCVQVQICAPPGCPVVKVRRRGTKITYDYGKYEIDITSKNGVVKVDYDD